MTTRVENFLKRIPIPNFMKVADTRSQTDRYFLYVRLSFFIFFIKNA